MKSVPAWMNHGRWLVDCPTCGGALNPDPITETVICSACYPDLRAMKQIAPKGAWLPVGKDGLPTTPEKAVGMLPPQGDWQTMPDAERIEAAMKQARKDGNELLAIYPPNRQQLEAIMRVRPKEAMNWFPENHPRLASLHETYHSLDYLASENLAMGFPEGD